MVSSSIVSGIVREIIQLTGQGIRIVSRRLRTQGVANTLLWIFVRGVVFITGIPFIRYNKITPEIYVGPQYRRLGKRKLELLGINASVNMRKEYDDAANNLNFEQYCHLPTVDDQAPSLEQLNLGVEFISRVVAQGGRVYIHCTGGIGRAPTMAAAYFISQGFKIDEAIGLISRSRPFVFITPAQINQLGRFEAQCRAG